MAFAKIKYFTREELLILLKSRRNALEIENERKNNLEREIQEIENELEKRIK